MPLIKKNRQVLNIQASNPCHLTEPMDRLPRVLLGCRTTSTWVSSKQLGLLECPSSQSCEADMVEVSGEKKSIDQGALIPWSH